MTATVPAPSLLNESIVSMAQAARRLPPFRSDRPVSPTTIWRWLTVGVRLPDGTKLKLEGLRLGGRWVTSVEALTRFAQRQTFTQGTALVGKADSPETRTANQRKRSSERAAQQLESFGV